MPCWGGGPRPQKSLQKVPAMSCALCCEGGGGGVSGHTAHCERCWPCLAHCVTGGVTQATGIAAKGAGPVSRAVLQGGVTQATELAVERCRPCLARCVARVGVTQATELAAERCRPCLTRCVARVGVTQAMGIAAKGAGPISHAVLQVGGLPDVLCGCINEFCGLQVRLYKESNCCLAQLKPADVESANVLHSESF